MNKTKQVRISYNIAENDLNTKRRQVRKFLDKGHSVKVQMRLTGRTKYLYKDAEDKLKSMFSDFKIVNSWNKNNNYYLFLNEN